MHVYRPKKERTVIKFPYLWSDRSSISFFVQKFHVTHYCARCATQLYQIICTHGGKTPVLALLLHFLKISNESNNAHYPCICGT
jgi:hypothetical protein